LFVQIHFKENFLRKTPPTQHKKTLRFAVRPRRLEKDCSFLQMGFLSGRTSDDHSIQRLPGT
jgi:hypothetical protein